MDFDITSFESCARVIETYTGQAPDEETTHMMLKQLNALSRKMTFKALEFSKNDQRDAISSKDIEQAFQSIGGGLTGTVKYHTVSSQYLVSQTRDIVVYLPPSYENNKSHNYPVIYMHDGQNIFDKYTGFLGREWYVNERMEYLIKEHMVEELIIVGIYNGGTERINEYTFSEMDNEGGGHGEKYASFLIEELKPYIDEHYRTKPDRENTGTIGSSMGGLLSFYLALKHPTVFSKVGMMSPSLWWKDCQALKDVELLDNQFEFDFWLDAGENEGEDMVDNLMSLNKILIAKLGHEHVLTYVNPAASHNESAWSFRIHAPIIQFFGTQEHNTEKIILINRLMSRLRKFNLQVPELTFSESQENA